MRHMPLPRSTCPFSQAWSGTIHCLPGSFFSLGPRTRASPPSREAGEAARRLRPPPGECGLRECGRSREPGTHLRRRGLPAPSRTRGAEAASGAVPRPESPRSRRRSSPGGGRFGPPGRFSAPEPGLRSAGPGAPPGAARAGTRRGRLLLPGSRPRRWRRRRRFPGAERL